MPRKSVVRLTDRPDMTLYVYRGRKTTTATTTTNLYMLSQICQSNQFLHKLPVPDNSRARAHCACSTGAGGGGCMDVFSLSLSLWKTARYRLKYCLKGPLTPKQTINHESNDKPYIRRRFKLVIRIKCQALYMGSF